MNFIPEKYRDIIAITDMSVMLERRQLKQNTKNNNDLVTMSSVGDGNEV